LPGNVVIFVGASQEFAKAVVQINKENPPRVVLRPIEFLCLAFDGGPIPKGMPLAKRPPKGGYKTEHFACVCFDLAKEVDK